MLILIKRVVNILSENKRKKIEEWLKICKEDSSSFLKFKCDHDVIESLIFH